MPFVPAGDIDIWYERSGEGTGRPTLVLTHGFAGPTACWPPIIDAFRRDFDLVLYDVRAHGRTGMPADPSAVTLPRFAADLAALLEGLGIERAHIGGVSMGGMISAQFACDFPERVRSLLLCDSTAGNGKGRDAEANEAETQLVVAFERMAAIVERHGLAELVRCENRYRRERDPYARLAVCSLDEQDERNRRSKVEQMTAAGYLAANRALRERPDLTSRTPRLTMPALVSCGEWDMFYPCARRDARLIPNARFVTIRGSAHATPDYQPHAWHRAVYDFIDAVERGQDVRGTIQIAAGAGPR